MDPASTYKAPTKCPRRRAALQTPPGPGRQEGPITGAWEDPEKDLGAHTGCMTLSFPHSLPLSS